MDTPKPRGWKGSDNDFTVTRILDGHIQPYLKLEDRTTTEHEDLANRHEC